MSLSTATNNTRQIICPQCKKQTFWDKNNPARPFCSVRCRTLDLGAWANESYRIAGATVDPENAQNLLGEEPSFPIFSP